MENLVYVKTYKDIDINIKEIVRYSGGKELTEELSVLIDQCLKETSDIFSYKVCFSLFDVTVTDKSVSFGAAEIYSKDLAKNLKGCKKVILMGATIGLGIDRLIAKYSSLAPSKALIFQAIGAERIEALADTFNGEIKNEFFEKGEFTRARFSPGYGDLPLEAQREIFRILDCPKKIGLTLNESLIMSPSKSVTAFIGVGENCLNEEKTKCSICSKKDCNFRRKL